MVDKVLAATASQGTQVSQKTLDVLSAVGTILDSGLDIVAVFQVGNNIIQAKRAATKDGETQAPYTEAELKPVTDLFAAADAALTAAIEEAKAKEAQAALIAAAKKS